MKKILTLILLGMNAIMVNAMSYDEARREALFLTDKMAYELNLNEEQYNYCYEINFDYLLGVVTPDDIYGVALRYRNADLRNILFDWQYTLFAAADYFIHPLRWIAGAWSYPIYRYYDAGRFFFDRPVVYLSYRGGHDRFHHAYGFYVDRRPEWRGGFRGHDRTPIIHNSNPGGSINRPGHDGYHIGGPSNGRSGYHIGGPSNGRGGYHVGGPSNDHSGYHVGGPSNDRSGHSNSGGIVPSNRGNHADVGSHSDHGTHTDAGQRPNRSDYGTNANRGGHAEVTSSQYTHPSSTRTIEGRANGGGRSSYSGDPHSYSSNPRSIYSSNRSDYSSSRSGSSHSSYSSGSTPRSHGSSSYSGSSRGSSYSGGSRSSSYSSGSRNSSYSGSSRSHSGSSHGSSHGHSSRGGRGGR